MPVSTLLSSAGKKTNFLRRATASGKEKTICVDPFAEKPPTLVSDITEYLATSGFDEESLQKASRVTKLQISSITQSYVRGKNVPWSKFDVSTAFAVLKHFLANLPYPLLTKQLLECFMLAIEVTRTQIPIQTKDTPEGEGNINHEKIQVKANIDGILQTVNRLPDGHYSTLRSISCVCNLAVKDPKNRITSSQIADFLAFELCNAKESHAKELLTDDVLKGHKIVECLVDDFSVIFEGAPIGDRELPKMPGMLQKRFAEQLRSSTMLLKVELEKEISEEQELEDVQISSDDLVTSSCYLNIDSSKKDLLILSSTHVTREWIMLGFFFLCSLIPMFVSFSSMTIVFSGMILVIIYINAPRKEVITCDKANKTISREIRAISTPNRKQVHSLADFQRFAIEQSAKKNGAYRLIIEFNNGMKIAVTEAYFFSEKAIAQRYVAAKLMRFLDLKSE